MIFKDNDKQTMHDVIGRCIDMYSYSLAQMVEIPDDDKHKATVLKAKANLIEYMLKYLKIKI